MHEFPQGCALCGKQTRDPRDGTGIVVTNTGRVVSVHIHCWRNLTATGQDWVRVYESRPPSSLVVRTVGR